MTHQIFVGYRRVDMAAAASLVRAIEAQGYTVFWDADLVSGDEFHEALNEKIDQSKAAIIIWSADMPAHTAVLMEAQRALRGKKLLLAAIDEGIKLFPAFQKLHYENLSPAAGGAEGYWSRLSGNDNWEAHPNFHKLMTAVRRKVGKPQAQKNRERRSFIRGSLIAGVVSALAAIAIVAYLQFGDRPVGSPQATPVEVADAAYRAAADPVSGYSDVLIESAILRLRDLEVSDPAAFTEERQRRLQALQLARVGAFRDCDTGCPLMRVILAPRPFAISAFETSVQEWSMCDECLPPTHWRDQLDAPSNPVRWVKHEDIDEFLNFLGRQAQAEHPNWRARFQLPSEREWLTAAGASVASGEGAERIHFVPFPTTTESVCDFVNGLNNDRRAGLDPPPDRNELCFDGYHREEWAPADPGSESRFQPNAAGIYHMIGNASEWLRDPCGDKIRIIGGSRWDRPVFQDRRVQVPATCDFGRFGNAHRGFRVMRPI